MGRWTQYDEDASRLPQGVTRVGYDADTRVYTFRDKQGQFYEGAPGEEYGFMTPIGKKKKEPESSRPEAFKSGVSQ